jgi:hypothetical protein
MADWTPELGLLKALTGLCHGVTPVVLTPVDRKVINWATEKGFRVAVMAGTCEIRRNPSHPEAK